MGIRGMQCAHEEQSAWRGKSIIQISSPCDSAELSTPPCVQCRVFCSMYVGEESRPRDSAERRRIHVSSSEFFAACTSGKSPGRTKTICISTVRAWRGCMVDGTHSTFLCRLSASCFEARHV